ncbi:hypothetical protein GCM10010329_75930 [Streptomyces spiroverticillatus]|uniref:DUF4352 domain-containing protein n=1 Tax=Streptomyces finlayi TaxID=67296 RepID=A0A918X7U0_9ACTN|nr:DUF4352 domain-containing protein [Streptomyces finlayi]GHA41645.1 hypothetical protein GCM10010329_75930 [Streptomyces spiroverticillatus]GHD16492.1 hypothetical protein GCM10010334_77540 [Streptomyces finlayi]
MSQHSNHPTYPQGPEPQYYGGQDGQPGGHPGGYPGGHGGHGAPRAARNGLGTAALILGLIGALSGLIPLMFWLAGVLGLIALILGLTGNGRVKRGEATNKGVTLTGAALGLVSLILSAVGAVLLFKAVDDGIKELDKTLSGQEATKKGGTADGAKSEDKAAGGEKAGKSDKDTALAAGDSAEYDDKLTVTVSAPTKFTPGEYAAGHTKGNKARLVTVVVHNAGTEKFNASTVMATARAGKDGTEAEQIFDEKAGTMFQGSILPGKKATVKYAFSIPADAKNLTVEIAPDFEHKASQWELKL